MAKPDSSPHRSRGARWSTGVSLGSVVLVGWSLALGLLLLGPALGAGFVLSYDMVWVPDLALRPDLLGVGSALPRAVPSDAVVAVLDQVVPGALLQKVVLLAPLVAGGLGVARLVPGLGLAGRLTAVSVYQWSPFVVERLVIGHWPVLIGYGVLPWVLLAARRWRGTGRVPPVLLLLLPLGSLSVSAGIATGVALLAGVAGVGRPGARRTASGVGLLLLANAPWLASGLLHAGSGRSDPAGAALFALSAEGSVPAPLAALSLGGIWNAEVVPVSREGVLGWVWLGLLLALAAVGLGAWRRGLGRRDTATLAVCWAVGLAAALLTWASPAAVGWLAEHVPGGGVLRDGARLLVLAAPAVATVAALGAERAVAFLEDDAARVLLAGGLVLLPVVLLPDAAWGVSGRLAPVDYPDDYAAARVVIADDAPPGDVLLLPLSSYRRPAWNDGRKVLDPGGRHQPRDFVTSDELVVSGTTMAGEDPRVGAVAAALAAPTGSDRAEALARLGIGVVVEDRTSGGTAPAVAGEELYVGPALRVTGLDGARPMTVPRGWVVTMTAAWLAFVLGPALALLRGARSVMPSRRRRTARVPAP